MKAIEFLQKAATLACQHLRQVLVLLGSVFADPQVATAILEPLRFHRHPGGVDLGVIEWPETGRPIAVAVVGGVPPILAAIDITAAQREGCSLA